MKNITIALSGILFLLLSLTVRADIVVVAHPSFEGMLDMDAARKYFMGKSHQLPNGKKVELYDLPVGDKTRAMFRKKVLRKSESRLNAYWARMLFSSKAQPPIALASPDAIKEIVSVSPNALAYLDSVDVDPSVKVVLIIK